MLFPERRQRQPKRPKRADAQPIAASQIIAERGAGITNRQHVISPFGGLGNSTMFRPSRKRIDDKGGMRLGLQTEMSGSKLRWSAQSSAGSATAWRLNNRRASRREALGAAAKVNGIRRWRTRHRS